MIESRDRVDNPKKTKRWYEIHIKERLTGDAEADLEMLKNEREGVRTIFRVLEKGIASKPLRPIVDGEDPIESYKKELKFINNLIDEIVNQ